MKALTSAFSTLSGVVRMARISIERDQNGYVVCATDPKIMAENQKPGSSSHWRDPDREYHFKTCDEACEFVKEIAEKALPLDPPPPDPFASAFKKAVADDGDKDD